MVKSFKKQNGYGYNLLLVAVFIGSLSLYTLSDSLDRTREVQDIRADSYIINAELFQEGMRKYYFAQCAVGDLTLENVMDFVSSKALIPDNYYLDGIANVEFAITQAIGRFPDFNVTFVMPEDDTDDRVINKLLLSGGRKEAHISGSEAVRFTKPLVLTTRQRMIMKESTLFGPRCALDPVAQI